MKRYDAQETATLLPYPELADALADILTTREPVQAPTRTILPLPQGGLLLVMPAADERLAITKLVTVHPGNAQHGRSTVQSEVLVLDATTGERLGLLDGAAVTGRRTAALSLLAARTLAPRPQGKLLIVGAGVQARAHLEAFRAGLGTEEVTIVSRTPAKAGALVDTARRLGMIATLVDDPGEAAQEADLIVTATTSAVPVLKGRLEPHQFVCAVGAFTPEMAELSPELIATSRVIVDTLAGAQAEAGELIQAAHAGVWGWREASELATHLDLNLGPSQPPPLRATVFKSVGHALFDLAACRLLMGRRTK